METSHAALNAVRYTEGIRGAKPKGNGMKRSMLRRIFPAVLGMLVLAMPAHGELLSKRYQFKAGVVLEMSVPTSGGLRLDTVTFEMPETVEGRLTVASGLLRAQVVVSNLGADARKVGLAIALYDDEDRLLAVASGGSKLASIKPDRARTYSLVFEGVFAEALRATTFQISLEEKN